MLHWPVCIVTLLTGVVSSHRHGRGGHQHRRGHSRRPADVSPLFMARGLVATVCISILPYICLLLLPPFDKDHPFLRVLLSFSAGALLGDSFLHLIPHSLTELGSITSAEEAASRCGQTVLAGIIVFLIIDKIVRICVCHVHGHSHDKKLEPGPVQNFTEKHGEESSLRRRNVSSEREAMDRPVPEKERANPISSSGILSLLADFTHNVTDGMAIGASFAAGHKIGYLTAVSILLHEIPHELGDYALLIKSGVRPLKAAQLQLVTAVGAILGCVFSSLAVHTQSASTVIMPMTAGGFIYVATVSILPDLINKTDKKSSSLLQIAAMVAGVACMFVVAWIE